MTEITIRDVRLRRSQGLFTPEGYQGGPEKYRAQFVIDPKANKEVVKLIRDTIDAVAKEKWKAKGAGIIDSVWGNRNKMCWLEEDYVNDDGDTPEGMEGMYLLTAVNDVAPGIYDRDRTELTKRDGRPYGGCYVVAKVDIWAQQNTHGKAIRAQLNGVQFLRDGDAWGGGKKSKADDFEDLSNKGDDDEAPRARRRAGSADDEDAAPRGRRRPAADEDDAPPARGSRRRPAADDDDIA